MSKTKVTKLAFLLAAFASSVANAGNECTIEFALNEMLGPPGSTSQVVSVVPYDTGGATSNVRVCWAPAAAKDKLGMDWQTPPAGALCTSSQTPVANTRLDFTMTGTTSGTQYWYKVQCDAPDAKNPGLLWTNRPVLSFKTLPAAGVDSDFTFTVNADTHFYAKWGDNAVDGGGCGGWEQHGTPISTGYRNMLYGLSQIAKIRGLFHVDLGDTYMVDNISTLTCGSSGMATPDGAPEDEYDGKLYNQVPGWPTRTSANLIKRGIQTAAVDATVRQNAEFHIFKTHRYFEPILGFSPYVFAWGNHDFPRVDVGQSNTIGSCGRWENDGQGSPKKATEHMGDAWRKLIYNPNTFYPNDESLCDVGGATTCDTGGYYYTFSAGLAQFWVLNPFQAAGGGGTAASLPYDLSGRYMEKPEDWELGQAQYQWFAAGVAASTAKWKFVMLHHLPGGTDSSNYTTGVINTSCQHYGRNAQLTTAGRKCDTNGDTVGEGKSCEIDDFEMQGFNEAQDDRPSAWKATYGACPAGIRCVPSPYNNRTAVMAGHATYGQPAVHALLKANIKSGGTNFYLQGHDHTTTAGCKFDPTGCSDNWHILGGQIEGTDDGYGGEPPPGWTDQGIFRIYSDGNGDTIPDYVADGLPYETPLDKEAGTIRQRGTTIRGFYKVDVSKEGVTLDYISSDKFDFPARYNTTIVSHNIGTQAIYETDLDGVLCADSESKNGNPTTCVNTAQGNPDAPALEGTQGYQTGYVSGVSTIIEQASAFTATNYAQADFLFNYITSYTSDGLTIPLFSFRNPTLANLGGIRSTTTGVDVVLVPYAGNPTTPVAGTNCPAPLVQGTTYQVRVTSNVAGGDITTLKMDSCDANDDNCDGALDISGAPVFVPTWGTGSFCNSTADGASVDTIEGIRIRAGSQLNHFFDALGICTADTGAFKCGDNFE